LNISVEYTCIYMPCKLILWGYVYFFTMTVVYFYIQCIYLSYNKIYSLSMVEGLDSKNLNRGLRFFHLHLTGIIDYKIPSTSHRHY